MLIRRAPIFSWEPIQYPEWRSEMDTVPSPSLGKSKPGVKSRPRQNDLGVSVVAGLVSLQR